MNKRQKKKDYKRKHGINPPGRCAIECHRFINEIISAICCETKFTEKYFEKRMLRLDLAGRKKVNDLRLQYDFVEMGEVAA